jgi:hypothetical protein
MNCSCRILVARAQHGPMFQHAVRSVSTVPLTHVGVIIFRHNIANEVLLLGNVVWRDARRCWKWLSRFGVRRGADHRSRHQCVAEQPSCAPTFTTMYYCSAFLFGGTRAVVAQCRSASARAALPTIDLASRARWCRRRVLQGCLRCTSTSCCCVTRRALMLDNVDPLRRGRSVDHRCRRPCMVAPPPCAPRLPTMYQCSLLSCGLTSADVGLCRLVHDARCSVDTRSRRPCTVAPPSCAPWLPTM